MDSKGQATEGRRVTGQREGPTTWFIAGFVRSGSTLLSGVLGNATGGINVGELHLLWRSIAVGRMCTCDSSVAECDLWSQVASRALNTSRLTMEEAVRAEIDEPRQRQILARGGRLGLDPRTLALRAATEQAIREVANVSVIVDASKVASTALVAAATGSRLRLVHLVRDPRAVAASMASPKPDPSLNGELMPATAPARTSMDWMGTNLSIERLTAGWPESSRLRYEDLVADPEAAIAALGLGPAVQRSPRMFHAGEHAVAGNPLRFEGSREVQLDARWRTSLPRRHRRLVEVMTMPLMTRYGYR